MLIGFKIKFMLPSIRFLPSFGLCEKIHDVILGNQRTAKNTHDLYDRKPMPLVVPNDSNETVFGAGNMNLNTYCIITLCP
jgi:hypothetical protein